VRWLLYAKRVARQGNGRGNVSRERVRNTVVARGATAVLLNDGPLVKRKFSPSPLSQAIATTLKLG